MQLLLSLFLLASTAVALAQQNAQTADPSILPDAPSHIAQRPEQTVDLAPNSHVSAEAALVPFTSRQYLNFAVSNGAGSASLIFAGGSTSAEADTPQGSGATPTNCGRTPVDKSNGSAWINSILSVTSHKGGRYCALGEGGFWKRGTYAMTRAFVAHRYDGNSFNASELLGPGTASAMPGSYYAYPNYTGERLAARYASAVGRDTLKNMFSEFWPDFATHVLRRHP